MIARIWVYISLQAQTFKWGVVCTTEFNLCGNGNTHGRKLCVEIYAALLSTNCMLHIAKTFLLPC